MKRLIPFLFLLLFFVPRAHASGIAVGPTCGPAASTTCTWSSTPARGDTLLCSAYRSSSATAPGTGTGYTSLTTTTGNTNSIRLGARFAIGSETTSTGWTNATQLFCQDYGGGYIFGNGTASGLFGITGANHSGITENASTAVSYPTLTLSNTLSTSWVVCAAGSASGSVDTAPSGMTLRSGTSITNVAFSDTNGIVSSWTTTAGPNPTAVNASACVEIQGNVAATSIASNIVTRVYAGSTDEACTSTCSMTVYLPQATLSNNRINVFFAWTYASVAPTVSTIFFNSDSGHATWTPTLDKSSLDTGNTTDAFLYFVDGATAGVKSVTITASSVWTQALVIVDEFNGVATSSAIDKSAAQTVSGSYLTAGSLAPTQSGDVHVTYCTTAGLTQVTSTGMFQSAGEQNLVTDNEFTVGAWGWVQTGSTALVDTLFTQGGSGGADCIGEALKASGGAGTAASGVHVDDYEVMYGGAGANPSFQVSNLKSGDASMAYVTGVLTGNAKQWSALSTLISTMTAHQPTDANGGYPNVALDCDESTLGDDLFNFTSAANTISSFFRFEISGLINSSHTACYDATAGNPTAAITSATANPTNLPSITPSTANGIVIAGSETGTGPGSAVTAPACGNWLVGVYTGQTDGSKMGAGNLVGDCINSSTSAQNWAWTIPSTTYNGAAIHLEAPAAAAYNAIPVVF